MIITCKNGHTAESKYWRSFDLDPAYMCCPVCGDYVSLLDVNRKKRPIPPGRESAHVSSLIKKVEAWHRSRVLSGFSGGCLEEVVKYLDEYRAMLATSEHARLKRSLTRVKEPAKKQPLIAEHVMIPDTSNDAASESG